MNAETVRLQEDRDKTKHWKRWGPYLSERAWGTVREDYSPDGTAWDYFPHDHARSRAYRWNEDGLAGICDRHQRICFALALWNGQRPDPQGAALRPDRQRGQPRRGRQGVLLLPRLARPRTPTCGASTSIRSARSPTTELVEENRAPRPRRARSSSWSTRASSTSDRYFDVFVEYAKADPEDILIAITVVNRGPEAAPLHLLPTLWFRNTWSWGATPRPELATRARRSGRRS